VPDGLQHFRITCLTPVHIGSGGEYVSGLDLISKDGKSFFLDSDLVLQQLYATGQLPRDVDDLKGKVAALFRTANVADYALAQGSGRAPEGLRIRALIRAGSGDPIMPGSSLKGALRTLLFAGRAGTGGPHTAMSADLASTFKQAAGSAQPRGKFAAQALEQVLFRSQAKRHNGDAKGDLMRTCLVSDAMFPADSSVILLTGAIGTQNDTLTGIEAFAAGSVAAAAMHLGDLYLKSKLFTESLPPWDQIAQWSREHAKFLLDGDLQYFTSGNAQNGCSGVIEMLQGLVSQIDRAPTDTIFLRLGWGTGWRTMTADLLQDSPERRRLLPKSTALGPKTRKVIVAGAERNARAIGVLGWISLEPISPNTAHELNTRTRQRARRMPVIAAQPPPSTSASFPDDQFIQGMSGLRTSDWGRVNNLYAQAVQEGERRNARLEALARRISEVWGRDRKRLAEARQKFPALAPYWK
jgi:CRISPR-associated protein Csm5